MKENKHIKKAPHSVIHTAVNFHVNPKKIDQFVSFRLKEKIKAK